MTIIVAGATGATGRLVVKQLLERGERVKAVVRYPEKLSEAILNHKNFSLIKAEISMMSISEMAEMESANACNL